MSPLSRRILLTIVVSLHLIVDLAAIPIAYRMQAGDGSGFALGVLFGVLLGQLSLLAAYLAWGLGHWIDRAVKAGFLLVLVWYAISAGAVSTGDSFEVSSIEQLLAMVVGLSFVFVAIPFWSLRPLVRRRRQLVAGGPSLAVATGLRFRVVHLLKWTTAAAVVCAILATRIGREVWGSDWSMSSGDWMTISLWMSLSAGISVLVAIPAMWACLGERSAARRLAAVGVFAGALVATEWAILHSLTGDDRMGVLVASLKLGVLCDVVPCALLLRICGYRFMV
jgi:hypothetical protein